MQNLNLWTALGYVLCGKTNVSFLCWTDFPLRGRYIPTKGTVVLISRCGWIKRIRNTWQLSITLHAFTYTYILIYTKYVLPRKQEYRSMNHLNFIDPNSQLILHILSYLSLPIWRYAFSRDVTFFGFLSQMISQNFWLVRSNNGCGNITTVWPFVEHFRCLNYD